MSLTCCRVAPGPAATSWLREHVRTLQAGDPLAAVTVVAPSNHAGLHLRRGLATTGYAGVRFTVIARLAEMLGASELERAGRTALTGAVRGALIRTALRTAGGPLAASAGHAGLVDLVAALDRELHHHADPPAAITAIRGTGNPTARAALAAVDEYRALIAAHRRYDDVDLVEAAAEAVRSERAASILADVGAVVVHLPERVDAATARLLGALAGRSRVDIALPDLGDDTPSIATLQIDDAAITAVTPAAARATTSVSIAVDAVEEVRSAVRDALAALERDSPVPLHRQAIVYRDGDAYGPLLRDTLIGAGVAYASLDGCPLAGTVPARALLGLLRLRDADFSRPAVLGWLSGLPHQGGVLRNQARWDKLSREAGVVRGVAQWVERLERLRNARLRRLAELEHDDTDELSGLRARLQADSEDCRRIAEHVQALAELTTPPVQRTWAAHVDWLQRLRDEVLTPDASWTQTDREAAQLVGEIVDGLRAAHDVEPEVDVAVVLRTLEDALRSRRIAEGRQGSGIVIGPHAELRGFDLDRVHVLGAVEGMFPAGMRPDPLLAGDPLERRAEHEAGERRSWRTALLVASDGEAVASAPRVDADGRTVYPSPWLLRLLEAGGERPQATAVREARATHPRLRHTASALSATYMQTPLSVAERREREALAAHLAGDDVAQLALARRDDLPLGAALRVARARRSDELTEFDGNLATAATSSPLLQDGLTGRDQSATRVELWARCPFHFLLGRVLRVSATEESDDERWWQIDAAERGTLVHAILERFFAEVIMTGRPLPGEEYTAEQHARMSAIARAAFADVEARGVTGHELVWENEQATILADLQYLLNKDAELRGEGHWMPAYLEQGFGIDADPRSWSAVDIGLPDERSVRFRGFIDRVDTAPGRARVVDYKTGRSDGYEVSVDNRLDAGRRLQLAVYARAVRERLTLDGDPPSQTTALYWFATARGGWRSPGITATAAVDEVLTHLLTTVDEGVRAGCFPQVPGDYDDHWHSYANCAHCEYDNLCPAGRDVLAATKRGSRGALSHRELADGDDDGGAPPPGENAP